MALRHGSVVNRNACSKQGCGHFQIVKRLINDRHVFLPNLVFHGGLAPGFGNHHGATHLKHARTARAVADDVDQAFGIQPQFLAKQNTFSCRHVVNGYQQIGHQLHLHAIAKLTHVVICAREAIKNGTE